MISIVMGSITDLKVLKAAAELINYFNHKYNLKLTYEIKIVSAHRTPLEMVNYAQLAVANKIKVIIAGAGGAAHLPGMIASLTPLPVIGVPVKTTALSGMDSLLSIAQMPAGIPVATVAIDNATNAGLLALRILSVADLEIQSALVKYQKEQIQKVDEMNVELKKDLTFI